MRSKAARCPQEGTDVRFGEWSQKDIDFLNTWQLLTSAYTAWRVMYFVAVFVSALEPVDI